MSQSKPIKVGEPSKASLATSSNASPNRASQLTRLVESPSRGGSPFESTSLSRSVGSRLAGKQRQGSFKDLSVITRDGASASPMTRIDGFVPAEDVKEDGVCGSVQSGLVGFENPEIVDRHLHSAQGPDVDDFASLQLQGGDIHRQVYQWSQQQKQSNLQARRSQSFYLPRHQDEDETMDVRNLKIPGGFRRNYIASKNPRTLNDNLHPGAESTIPSQQPEFLTRNFIEFLSIYGHFAGEDLEDDEDDLSDNDEASAGFADTEAEPLHDGERRPLLAPRKSTRRKPRNDSQGDATPTKAVMLLLKSFVGTGVLFLPKAFLNGGMLFSSMVLLGVSAISLYCFLLLVNTRLAVVPPSSFGDLGGVLYGKKFRNAILVSIAISQLGFVCAYTAFTAENLGAFIEAVTNGRVQWDISALILVQLVIFLPLSLIRDISKLGFTALIADAFILLGLVYLYWADLDQIVKHGMGDIVLFNTQDWTLFIGTAIFTFEGIGLIIPIVQTMKEPEKFPAALGGVMLFITVLFTSIGALSYAAFGSKTKTVILSNLPQDNRFVNSVQLLYSLAILLSTPLQLFPAIRILETAIFTRSGKYSLKAKWNKNLFRITIVLVSSLLAWLGSDDLDKFVSLIGSFACVPLVFVYPALLHYKIAQTSFQRGADIALAIFGILAMIYTTATSISSWIVA